MVNLELYRVFYTVARCGSLTKAAEELFISQPAVSQAIKQLETQLGTTLFNRTHRGMELSTQGGKIIFKNVESALQLLDEAEERIKAMNTTASGTIRIGATDTIFKHFLADKIVQYHEKYPAVRIVLSASTSPETIRQLKENKCDVGFINLPVEDRDILFTSGGMNLNDIFITGEKYKAVSDHPVPLKSLMNFPLLLMDTDTVARRSFDAYTKQIGIHLQPDLETASWDLMTRLVQKGMGIGCIPREYVKKELEEGSLFEVKTEPALPTRSVGIALPKNTVLSYALKIFLSTFE